MAIQINLDPNARRDPVLNNTGFISNENLKRIVNIAIPFLSLHKSASRVVSTSIGSFKSICIIVSANKNFINGKWKN